jgi:predicted phosphodiesterase
MSLSLKECNQKLTILLPDIHLPIHDEVALSVANKIIKKLKPRKVIQLGDLLDASAFSSHNHISFDEMVDGYMSTEIEPARNLITYWLENSNEVVILLGNHCGRVERWALQQGFAGRAAFDALDPKVLLKQNFTDKDLTIIDYSIAKDPSLARYNVCHDLWAVHGWSTSQNAGKAHLDKARSASVCYGHAHRASMYSSRDPFSGKILKAFCPGCLCKLQPLYMTGGTPSDWTHGIALVYHGATSWTEYVVSIDKGCAILPDGTEVKA